MRRFSSDSNSPIEWGSPDAYNPILQSFFNSAKYFDRFLDFSVPSPLTLDASLTWDGTHYKAEVNELLIPRLLGQASDGPIDLKNISFEEYQSIYLERITDLVQINLPQHLDAQLKMLSSQSSRDWMNNSYNR